MSTSSDNSEYELVAVDLRCEFPGAEVWLVNGQQQVVARGVQSLHTEVSPGVYTSRVSIGDSLRDERHIVRPDKPFSRTLDAPPVSSAIPLTGSTTSHEYHQAAVGNASATSAEVALHADGDSSIFVSLREWTTEGQGRRSRGPLASALTLWSADGGDLHTFTDMADTGQGDRAAVQGVRIRQGFYRLASRIDDAVIEMPVYALPNWQMQIYLLSKPAPVGLAPDFSRAAMLWARPGIGFDPNREDLRILESVRFAAEAGRQHLTDKGLTDALYEKYSNPMLGLLSAHALWQRQAIDPSLLAQVTKNLEAMLGPIPDVIALELALAPDADVAPVEYPPLLRWSWDLLLRRSVDRPDIIRRHSFAERVGCHVVGRGVWMSWMADANAERFGSSPQTAILESSATAVRSAWQQLERTWPSPSRKSGKKAAAAPESLDSTNVSFATRADLTGLVKQFGLPRGFIEEAVGSAALTAASTAAPHEASTGVSFMNLDKRRQFNERFLQRLLARRPQDRAEIEQRLQQQARVVPEAAADLTLDPTGTIRRDPRDIALETIVNRERPVLFVRDGKFDLNEVTTLGPDAVDLVDRMKQQGSRLFSLLPLIGRIDVLNFPNAEFVGTGWFVDTDIVVTNRHVASLIARWDGRQFAFTRGVGGATVESSVCNAHEFDDLAPDAARVFKVIEVLYIERDSGPDIAFLRVQRRTDGGTPPFITVAPQDAIAETPVCVIGYPARASRRVIPDQALMKQLYRDRFDVKRAAPGFTSGQDGASTTHDCTTLGGNSGSVVLDLATGMAVGLHFAGLYEEDNFAVPASVLTDYIRRKRWNTPPRIESQSPAQPTPPAAVAPIPSAPTFPTPVIPATTGTGATSLSITIPLTVTLTIGTPQSSGLPQTIITASGAGTASPISPVAPGDPSPPNAPGVDVARVETVLVEFWDQRPPGVLAARVGFLDKNGSIGDVPCIAASVKPSELGSFELGGPAQFRGVAVRYLPADIDEQVQALPSFESVDSIAYDDNARTGERFSFAPVNEPMEVTLHVGPEYSWEVLENFLKDSQGRLVSAMYEFHASHIKDALEARLDEGGSLTLVLDNATFSKMHGGNESFDRVGVFEDWADRFPFTRIVAPEGLQGLISDSYHIKVTVRDDDTFWLSSGNWKAGSSQPIITQQQRDDAAEEDLPGNREWHVVIKNKRLASRFRNHILQDFSRSETLGGGPVSPSLMDETFVDIPIEEAVVLERPPPSRILKPKTINRKVKVRPLLTPDQEGAIYSEAVLDLIQSARTSLLFQIPYIGMPPNPRQDRGFIDDLIRALTAKLKTLDDARVLLRSGGSKFSAPTHAAWFFKSKGVDITNRLRVIENHHTKGMVVDGRRVLLGSHNWSKPGVSLNRDASLIFDDEEVAQYYTDAFEIDWERARTLRPRQFVKETVVLEAVGDAPPAGFQRVRLSDLVKDDD
jgi:hypothetical protein